MDRPKRRGRTCCGASSGSNKNQEKENVAAASGQARASSKRCCSTNTKRQNLPSDGVPSSAPSIIPDKKLKTPAAQLKNDGSSHVTRPVLQDLDKNISEKPLTNVQAVKTVLVAKTLHVQKKIHPERATQTGHGAGPTTCCGKYANLTDSQKLRAGNRLRLPSTGSKVATPNQVLEMKTSTTDPRFSKVTVRQRLTPQQQQDWNQASNSGAEVFVDSSKHYITFTPYPRSSQGRDAASNKVRYISPVKSSLAVGTSMVIHQGIPEGVRRPAKKLTLTQKKQPESRKGRSAAYCLDIYEVEYLEDIMCCQLRNDWKYILKEKSLRFQDSQSMQNRAVVINWLIQAHDYLDLFPSVLFTTIRLFDKLLDSTSIAYNMYQLVGLVTMWIVSKFEDKNHLESSKLLALCKNVYSIQDFLKMEKKLLPLFNFDIKIPDVTAYISYYFKKMSIESNQFLYAAFYILECYTLKPKFSTVIPSIQAAAAACLTLKTLQPYSERWKRLEKEVGYYSERELQDTMHEMRKQLRKMLDSTYQYRQPYKKYATSDKLQVSLQIMHKLTVA